ncbi:MAG: LacI family transcriptional regulator [Clostridiales bacterium]|nr:LacI family transcriptional regulator [Clostridiales bacterium]
MSSRTTIYDIAKIAGVSTATVSRVIHHPETVAAATREKVHAAFDAAHIAPEQLDLRRPRSRAVPEKNRRRLPTVLVYFPVWDSTFFDGILNTMRVTLKENGYFMLIYSDVIDDKSVEFFLNLANDYQISGVLSLYKLPKNIMDQVTARYPVVQCSDYNASCPNVPYVTIDDYSYAFAAVRRLLDSGCRRIGFFSIPFYLQYTMNRYEATKAALQNNGMELLEADVITCSDFDYQRLLSAAMRFFHETDHPDGIFCTSDQLANAVVNAAGRSGIRVPEQVKVIGFDDTSYAICSSPAITTVRQPREELGREAVFLLLRMIESPYAAHSSVILPAEIVFREST